MALFLVKTYSKSIILTPLIVIAPLSINSLASLLEVVIEAFTNNSTMFSLFSMVVVGTSLKASSISLVDSSFTLPLNNVSVMRRAFLYASSPWINETISLLKAFCPILSSGFNLLSLKIFSMTSLFNKVKVLKYLSKSSSLVFKKYWYMAYGDVREASNHKAPLSLFPNFLPSALVSNGELIPTTGASKLTVFLINSSPAVILPHWSDPPNWTLQLYVL